MDPVAQLQAVVHQAASGLVDAAVAPPQLERPPKAELGDYSTNAAMMLTRSLGKQPREIAECVAETGKRPVELLDHLGVLSSRFVAVHATHFDPHEAELFGRAKAFACVCATTESDLGDGLPDLASLRGAGARLCTGIDSHVITDP